MIHLYNSDSHRQTAYQRWELASLDNATAFDGQIIGPPAAVGVALANELICLRETAYQSAFSEGMEKGLVDGYNKGYASGVERGIAEGRERSDATCDLLLKLTQQYQQDIRLVRENIAAQLLDLSLDIAKAMLKVALPIYPDLLLPIIEQALLELSALQLPITIYLHPLDIDIARLVIEKDIPVTGFHLLVDSKIDRGGCRIETITSQIDATLPARWLRLQLSLGQNTAWLAKES